MQGGDAEEAHEEAAPEGGAAAGFEAPAAQAALVEAVRRLVRADVEAVADDYALLQTLNQHATARYADMATVTKSLNVHVEDVKSKYRSFEPYLARVDEICDSVAKLEQTVLMLDDYTMRLVGNLFSLFFFFFFSSTTRRPSLPTWDRPSRPKRRRPKTRLKRKRIHQTSPELRATLSHWNVSAREETLLLLLRCITRSLNESSFPW